MKTFIDNHAIAEQESSPRYVKAAMLRKIKADINNRGLRQAELQKQAIKINERIRFYGDHILSRDEAIEIYQRAIDQYKESLLNKK